MRFLTFPALFVAAVLLLGACSGDSDDDPVASASTSDDETEVDAAERDVTGDDADEAETTTTETTPDDEPVEASAPALDASVDGSDITLLWDDVDGLRWEVLRDGTDLDTTGDATFVDPGLDDGAYHYQVVAIGTEGDRAESAVLIVEVGEPDVDAPPAPSDVTVDATDEQVVIAWQPPDDLDDVRGYLVHRDRVFIAYVDDDTAYVDTDIEPGRAYNYRIRTQDDAGNVSEPEAARVPGESDMTPPTAPSMPTITTDGNDLVITWGESTDDEGIWGYLVHRDGEFVLWTGLDLEFREPAPADGSMPIYLIRSQDFTGNVSVPSRAFDADASLRRGGTDQALS
ncbi:MAG: hypothetical protein AAGA37_19650 [Actinomycetota bacterium]